MIHGKKEGIGKHYVERLLGFKEQDKRGEKSRESVRSKNFKDLGR